MTETPNFSQKPIAYQPEILSGTLIKQRYLIQKTLGQGGCGRTYLASDRERFDKLCVLKEFLPSNNKENVVKKLKELFEREARVLNNLEHPQIPSFFGWFAENNRLFLVQDFVDGQSYADLLKQGAKLSEEEIIKFLHDLLPVLDYIHTRNIIHRDLSPDNIMLPRDRDKPVLIDFGVVNKQNLAQTQHNNSSFAFVTTVGKMGYSPREQISTGQCYPSSDLYALAVTAIVLLTGKPPQDLVSTDGVTWIWQKYTIVSHNLQLVLNKMLQANPQERYQSAKEVTTALNAQPFVQQQNLSQNNSKIATTFVVASSENQKNKVNSTAETISVAPAAPSQETRHTSTKRQTPPFIYILILLALVGATFLGIKSPEIKGLCKILNNCELERLW